MRQKLVNRYCDGITRRDAIRVGTLSALGLGVHDIWKCQAAMASSGEVAKAKSCILIWLDGGLSHLDSWDPKPQAASEVRGPLGSIKTSVPGVRLNECFTQLAGLQSDFSIVRSVTSPLGEHNFGTHYMLTGYKPTPALEYPTFGSALAQHRGIENAAELPPHITLPSFPAAVSGNGFLPSATQPFVVAGEKRSAKYKVQDLNPFGDLSLQQLNRRRSMLSALDAMAESLQVSGGSGKSDLDRAFELMTSKNARLAFDLEQEPESIRNRYGRDLIGQGCLLARRLVENGVPFITVHSTGWDTHQNLEQLRERYPGDRNAKLPSLDRAVASLISDLKDRRLLDETLVLVMGEFGRTPRINANGGRDHWPNVFSVAMAGGGIRGGQVVGSSDALGEFPDEQPVTPADLAATIYAQLGIPSKAELRTSDGRPVRIVQDEANIIADLV